MDRRETGSDAHAPTSERVLVVDDDGLLADGLAALARGFGMDARRVRPADVRDVAGSFRPTGLVVSSTQPAAESTDLPDLDSSARVVWLDVEDQAGDGPATAPSRPRITADLDPVHLKALLAGDPCDMTTPVADTSRGPFNGSTTATYDERLIASLTVRERSVLEELATGGTNGAIAQRLGVSPNTVRTHVQNIFNKLDVRSRLEAVALAVGAGLITSHTDAPA